MKELNALIIMSFFLNFTGLVFAFLYCVNRQDYVMNALNSMSNKIADLEMQKFLKKKKKRLQ